MNRYIAIAAAALALLGGAYFLQPSTATDLAAFGSAEAQTAQAEVDTSLVVEMTLGDENAPLTVIEYASFTCPHCRSFHDNTFAAFKSSYIDTGRVRFIYREVYFDRFGLWAGMVARCGGPERYFGISDMIYDQQSTWTAGDTPAAIADNLARIGKTAGLTSEEVDACLQDGDLAQAMVAVYQENAERDGIRSTPSFLIDGELVAGDQSFAAFSALLDARLAE
ncbi:MAG: DsbA family protein [Rhodobacter sp.]|nr:DsbA family protein [Rhodobacter sp.]